MNDIEEITVWLVKDHSGKERTFKTQEAALDFYNNDYLTVENRISKKIESTREHIKSVSSSIRVLKDIKLPKIEKEINADYSNQEMIIYNTFNNQNYKYSRGVRFYRKDMGKSNWKLLLESKRLMDKLYRDYLIKSLKTKRDELKVLKDNLAFAKKQLVDFKMKNSKETDWQEK